MLKRNKSKLIQRLLAIAFLLIGCVFLNAIEASAQSKTIAGDWEAEMNTPGGVRTMKVTFLVEGEKLTGTIKRSTGDVALVGTIKGKDVEFSYTVQYNGNNLTLSVSGKYEGDTINGTVSFGESGQQDGWNAKRVAETKPKNDK